MMPEVKRMSEEDTLPLRVSLLQLWKENLRENYKSVSITIGQLIIVLVSGISFVVKEGLDIVAALIFVGFTIQPFFNWFMNLIFKGENKILQDEITALKREILHQRDVAEYKITLASMGKNVNGAVKSNTDWTTMNDRILELEEKLKKYDNIS